MHWLNSTCSMLMYPPPFNISLPFRKSFLGSYCNAVSLLEQCSLCFLHDQSIVLLTSRVVRALFSALLAWSEHSLFSVLLAWPEHYFLLFSCGLLLITAVNPLACIIGRSQNTGCVLSAFIFPGSPSVPGRECLGKQNKLKQNFLPKESGH